MRDELRKLPSVDRLLQEPAVHNLVQTYGRDLVYWWAGSAAANLVTCGVQGVAQPLDGELVAVCLN